MRASEDERRPSRRAPDGGVVAIAVVVVAALVATATRYGYHRDELYFLAAGRHLAWGYADQGPLTPLVARLASAVDDDSLTVLRLPSALATGAIVLLTSALARQLGAGRVGQRIAAASVGFSVFFVFTGHLLSTTTIDLLVWTAATCLATRALHGGSARHWLALGAVLGVGLLNKPLPAFFGVALLLGLLLVGPRRLLATPGPWLGALIAIVLGAPYAGWQAMHGWPQLTVAADIAHGGSASSQPWWAVLPFQLLLVGPPLAPVWIAGLVRLSRGRDTAVRDLRSFAAAWALLAVGYMATDGKPYYLGGLLPLLVAAGAAPAERWVTRGRRTARRALLGVAVATSVVATAVLALPLLPARDAGPVVASNPDVGETVGWPGLVATVSGVVHRLPDPSGIVVLAENYGEAGALERFGARYGIRHVASGDNAYGYWGPPHAAADRPVVVVGYAPASAARWLRGCRAAAHVHDRAGLDNDEDGAPVLACSGVRGSWAAQWPHIRHLG